MVDQTGPRQDGGCGWGLRGGWTCFGGERDNIKLPSTEDPSCGFLVPSKGHREAWGSDSGG